MHSEAPISYTVKIEGTDLLTFRANTEEEFIQRAMNGGPVIEWAKHLHQLANGGASAPAPAQAPAAPAYTPAPAPAAAPVVEDSVGPAPACRHGQMKWVVSKDPSNPWKGWFCAAPNGTPKEQKCKNQYIK